MDRKGGSRPPVFRRAAANAGRQHRHDSRNDFIIQASWGANFDTVDPLYSFPAKTQGCSAEMLLEFWLPPEPVDMGGP